MNKKILKLQKALNQHNSASFPQGNIGASGKITNTNRLKDHSNDSMNTKESSPSKFNEEQQRTQRDKRNTVTDKDLKDAGKLPPLRPLQSIKPAKPVLPAKPRLPKP